MKLHVTGINHRTAPVEVRERVAFSDAALPDALRELRESAGFHEGLILSTCNRVEIAVATDDQVDAQRSLEEFLGRARHVESKKLRAHLYTYDDRDAIRHLFRVASSLDSMVLGEPQILGQLKQAYAVAKSSGAVGTYLDTVLTRAFSVAKRVRTETMIGQNAVSVSFAAVELAREIFGNLKDCRVLLVGAGKMSELAARHLHRSGVSRILVTNRTRSRAEEMAAIFSGTIIDYDAFAQSLPEVDIVITSSGAPHYLLTREQVQRAMGLRRGRPMFLIDIAVPRNIEPAVNQLENVFLYDIDDLGKVVDQNRKERESEAATGEAIIAEEVEKLVARLKTRAATPIIVELQEHLDHLRRAELQRMRAKLGALSPQQEEALEALTKGLMNKVAHGAISELRKAATQEDGWQAVALVRRLFRLETDE
ncbi:MAG: glutamyl-tRNA reductase [Acidobacteriaceae bacterium]|jgi:glutamyl-tRNA reductase|nr:glutamyl-tRNA reductase [Acidobacteriaceae bacterium]